MLRQSKHCDLSREDAEQTEKHTDRNRNRIVIGRILIGRRRTLPLCHYQQPVPETLQSPCPALPLVLRCFPVQRVFNHQAPLICHLSGTFHGVENSSDTSHRSPRRRRRRRCHRSQARLSPPPPPSPPPPFSSCLLRLHCRVFNLALTVLAFAFHRATSTSTELQLPLPLPFRSSLTPLERRHSGKRRLPS